MEQQTKSVFEYKHYKAYLKAVLGAGVRTGLRARLAQHVECQTAHVSQVLNGHTHFSQEQAFRINSFLGHDREESHYFSLLVSKDRAGTTELKSYYQQQMDEILKRRSIIKNRVGESREVPLEHQARYYSSWHYAAVHMALALPELQSKDALAKYFSLPLPVIAETLEFLISTGLCAFENGRYQIGSGHIHLGHDSDNIQKHHTNWRLRAVDSMTRNSTEDLHYSVIYSLSASDAEKVKEKIIALIKANLEIVGPSPSEKLYCSCMDFFELKRG